jgi:hypothetical protein
MALFNTPNLLDIIWRKQEYPQDGGGLAGLLEGFGSGLGVGKQFKADKKEWKATEAAEQGGTKSTKTWGEVGRQAPAEKPNALHYFFGQGSPAVAGEQANRAFPQQQAAQTPITQQTSGVSNVNGEIDKLINAILAMLGSGSGGSMTLPR